MNITILAGKCTEDNNAKVFELLRNRDKTKNNYIIAPDRSLFSIERRLFDELNESCFFDLSVLSFSKLAKKLIKNTNKNILTKQSGVALVKKLLIENKDKLLTFGKATNFMGFATSLFETICLFKSCNISCDNIFVNESNDYSNLKAKDIKLIYSEYEKFLQNDFTDSFNQLKLFADEINRDFCKDSNFYIVEFDDFTALMYSIISKLARFSDNFVICTTYGKENINSNIYTNKVYYDLIDLFKFEGLHYNIEKIVNDDILVNNLLAYTPQKYDKSFDKITINQFENKSDEITFAVADIYNNVLKTEADFGDFVIILPTMQPYKKDLELELNKYKIPYYFDESEKLINYPFVRLLFNICNLFDGKFAVSDILNICKNDLLNFPIDDICDFDNFLQRTGIKGLMCLDFQSQNEEVKDFFEKIKYWIDLSKKSKIIKNHYEIIVDIYNFIIKKSIEFVSKLNDIEIRVFEQFKNKFESIEKDYISVFGDGESNFSDFLETYQSYFESTNISLPPITSNTVFIADFEKSYISKTKYLYILGCNEGKLPSYKIDNGLITDDEIAKFPNANKINPTIGLINARKTFKLFEIMQKAKVHTKLSYFSGSSEGKFYPNMLIKSILNIFNLEIFDGSKYLDFVTNSLLKINNENLAFNNLTKDKITHNVLSLVKNWKVYSSYPNYRKILALLVNLLDDKNIYNLIDNDKLNVQKIKLNNFNCFKNNTTSISQIETYFNCPYKHFARYGLKIEKNDNAQLKPNDIGTIIHAVLKEIMPSILNSTNTNDVIIKSEKILSDILLSEDYKLFASNPINSYIIKALKKELIRIINGIFEQVSCGSYKPNLKYLEYSFVNSNLTSSGVKIKGTIDRVDTWNDNFVIIDYKTGDSRFDSFTDVVSGKKLQLLVYAKAFADKSKFKVGGAFYFPISNAYSKTKQSYKLMGVLNRDKDNIYAIDNNLTASSYKSQVVNLSTTQSGEFAKNSAFFNNMCLSFEDMNYLIDYAIKNVNVAIENIISGDIAPHPLKTNNVDVCSYCDYKGLCNYQKNNDRYVQNVATIESLKNLRG